MKKTFIATILTLSLICAFSCTSHFDRQKDLEIKFASQAIDKDLLGSWCGIKGEEEDLGLQFTDNHDVLSFGIKGKKFEQFSRRMFYTKDGKIYKLSEADSKSTGRKTSYSYKIENDTLTCDLQAINKKYVRLTLVK